ncbi:helix-turn-helix transcriptional regulator [Agrobacterium vitis]|uniref:LuxR family transcriptional regulator n=1 Tax=Agrobacterium vitis TaxID=373 RepID=A0A7K1RFR5_AGRVI|nr:LuxR family transcriptional regulator [Agrobacterium vitis]MVA56833.1 LuxR family transcriptional regulator [Agrobacterium vitis]
MNEKSFSSDLSQTISFLEEIRTLETLAELATSIKRVASTYGIVKILSGFMPHSGSLPAEQMRNILLADWPSEWADVYFQNGYVFEDPTIKRVRRVETAFTWSDLAKKNEITRKERFVMDGAKEHQLKDGCTVPLVSLDGRLAGFSFAGTDIDTSPEARGALTLIATFAFGRAIELRNNKNKQAVKLTAREQEVLRWLSAGKTDWEISVILGVSEKTIEKHIANIRLKLNAVNRYHALAEAFRQNVIS